MGWNKIFVINVFKFVHSYCGGPVKLDLFLTCFKYLRLKAVMAGYDKSIGRAGLDYEN